MMEERSQVSVAEGKANLMNLSLIDVAVKSSMTVCVCYLCVHKKCVCMGVRGNEAGRERMSL